MTEILKDWRTVCKLTDANGQTYNNTQWGPNVTNPCGKLLGEGGLCGSGFYHAYHTPEIAAFLNPAHAAFEQPRFWLAEIRGTAEVDRAIIKLGASEMRTVREIPAIVPTNRQRQVFAVCVAANILESTGQVIPVWDAWAQQVLAGDPAAYAAANAAAYAAAYAATAAAYAANATAYAAAAYATANANANTTATAYAAANAAANAAYAADDAAANAAAYAAYAADDAAAITGIILNAAVYALYVDGAQ